jgi:hypothetical protein
VYGAHVVIEMISARESSCTLCVRVRPFATVCGAFVHLQRVACTECAVAHGAREWFVVCVQHVVAL